MIETPKTRLANAVAAAKLPAHLKFGISMALPFVSDDMLDPDIMDTVLQGVAAINAHEFDEASEIFHNFVDRMIEGLRNEANRK